jgi:hypothetical protein
LVGVVLNNGQKITCTYRAQICGQPGTVSNSLSITARDQRNTETSGQASASVSLADVPPTVTAAASVTSQTCTADDPMRLQVGIQSKISVSKVSSDTLTATSWNVVLSGGALAAGTTQTQSCSGEAGALSNGDNLCTVSFTLASSATPYVATSHVTVQGDESFSFSGSQQIQIIFHHEVTAGAFVTS